jgi:peptidyl-prolyl cis-trans isomerase C
MALQLSTDSERNLKRPESMQPSLQSRSAASLVLRRWLREPLLHFLLIGALIFASYNLLSPIGNGTDQASRIVLTLDDLRQLAVQWLAQGRPPATPSEMRGLVEQKVSEEILSREALALGLDKNDEMIKRRLAQKMDFLAEDIAALQDPGDAACPR